MWTSQHADAYRVKHIMFGPHEEKSSYWVRNSGWGNLDPALTISEDTCMPHLRSPRSFIIYVCQYNHQTAGHRKSNRGKSNIKRKNIFQPREADSFLANEVTRGRAYACRKQRFASVLGGASLYPTIFFIYSTGMHIRESQRTYMHAMYD